MTAPARQDVLFEVAPEPEPAPPPAPAPKVKKAPARESDGVVAIYLAATGQKYKYQGAADAEAWKAMRSVADVAEIEARWRVGLAAKGWLHVSTLAQLSAKWNDLGALAVNVAAIARPGADSYACDACGASVDALTQGRRWVDKQWLCSPCFRKQTPYEWKGAT